MWGSNNFGQCLSAASLTTAKDVSLTTVQEPHPRKVPTPCFLPLHLDKQPNATTNSQSTKKLTSSTASKAVLLAAGHWHSVVVVE